MDMVGCNPNYVFNMDIIKLENKKTIMTKEELIKFLESKEQKYVPCYKKTHITDVWKWDNPVVDGMMPQITITEQEVIFEQHQLWGDSTIRHLTYLEFYQELIN
jgi:hypothetical protein